MSGIPFLRPKLPSIDDAMVYLRRVDESRIYSNFGPLNAELEERIRSEYFDDRGALTTVHNATLGLVLAISATRRPTGRYAVMPSFTFAATPLAAMWCGLQPYFVDIRADDFCADENCVADVVRKLGDQVAVVVPYAAFGTACDLSYYESLIASGVPVVVDAAASFGTRNDDGQFGAEFCGPIIFSFHATKAFGIGEGGLAYSADPRVIERIRRASNFGFSASRQSDILGLNAKLSEYAAAMGLAVLDGFEEKIRMRQRIHASYVERMDSRRLLGRGWQLQQTSGTIPHQFMGVLCPDNRTNEEYVSALGARGIQARTYFAPACHEQPLFSSSPSGCLSVTENVRRRTLNLPLWEDLGDAQIDRIVEALNEI